MVKEFFLLLIFSLSLLVGCQPIKQGAATSLRLPPPYVLTDDARGEGTPYYSLADNVQLSIAEWDLLHKAITDASSHIRESPRRINLREFEITQRYPLAPNRFDSIPNAHWVWLRWHLTHLHPRLEKEEKEFFSKRRPDFLQQKPEITLAGRMYRITDLILIQAPAGNGRILIKPEGKEILLEFGFEDADVAAFEKWVKGQTEWIRKTQGASTPPSSGKTDVLNSVPNPDFSIDDLAFLSPVNPNWHLKSLIQEAIARIPKGSRPIRRDMKTFSPTSNYPDLPPPPADIDPEAYPAVQPYWPSPEGRWVWLSWWHGASVTIAGKSYLIWDLFFVFDPRTGRGKILITPLQTPGVLLSFDFQGLPTEPLRDWLLIRTKGPGYLPPPLFLVVDSFQIQEVFDPPYDRRSFVGWGVLSDSLRNVLGPLFRMELQPEAVPVRAFPITADWADPKAFPRRATAACGPSGLLDGNKRWLWLSWVPGNIPTLAEGVRQHREQMRNYPLEHGQESYQPTSVFLGGKKYRITDLILILHPESSHPTSEPFVGHTEILIRTMEEPQTLLRFTPSRALPLSILQTWLDQQSDCW